MQALTRPPLTFRDLVKQRVRWNLGYLETFYKERGYYFKQMRQRTRVGVVTLIDIGIVFFLLMLPLLLLGLAFVNITGLLYFLLTVYAGGILWCVCLLAFSPDESMEIGGKRIGAIVAFPAIKVAMDYLGWSRAFIAFIKKSRSGG